MNSSQSFQVEHFLAGWIGGERSDVPILLLIDYLGFRHVRLLQIHFVFHSLLHDHSSTVIRPLPIHFHVKTSPLL